MTARRPPQFATWMLKRTLADSRAESLIGDLTEAYQRGRSRRWFWRQVTFAVLANAFHDVRSHRLLAIRAVVVGWASFYLFIWLAGDFISRRMLGGWVLDRLIILSTQSDGTWRTASLGVFVMAWATTLRFLPVLCLALLLSGWTVSRLHRLHEAGMLLTFSLSFVVATGWYMGRWFLLPHESSAADVLGLPLFFWTNVVLAPPLIFLGGLGRTPAQNAALR